MFNVVLYVIVMTYVYNNERMVTLFFVFFFKNKLFFAEEMSLYDIVSKKNYKIILYAYACIHY